MSGGANSTLKTELAGLFHYIQRVRVEIAGIHRPADEDNNFDKMSDQLDAIVEATEQATDTIM
jgi:chemotaxis protein CheZ